MSKIIFVVTTETYCDGDYDLEIEGTFTNKKDATKEMKLCADDFIEDSDLDESEYERCNKKDTIILKFNLTGCETRISVHKTTVDESNFE
jgi:hypothetical protein